jgi:hypothetical protein
MMDQSLIHENLDFIRQSEYFRYLEEETIEPLLARASRIEVTRGRLSFFPPPPHDPRHPRKDTHKTPSPPSL